MVDTENPIIKGVINNLASAIEALKNQIATIDEEYKKKLEEAKASLVACLAETEKQLEYWTNLTDFTAGPVAPVKKRRTRKPAVEETPAEPVDDNLPFVEEEKVVDKEAVEETAEDQGPEFDGAGFTDADNEPTQQELDSANEFEAEQQAKSDDVEGWEEESKEEEKKDDEGWPEFPEEWK